MTSYLRGSVECSSDPLFGRRLQQVDTSNSSSLMFITIIVGLICAFYLICTLHCMRIWLCRRFFGTDIEARNRQVDDTVLVHEGRVFNLSGEQRRAVLEAIFSEATSEAVTDQDAKNKHKKKKDNGGADDDDGVPLDVEIPGAPTAGTEASMETRSSPLCRVEVDDVNSEFSSEEDIENAEKVEHEDLSGGKKMPSPPSTANPTAGDIARTPEPETLVLENITCHQESPQLTKAADDEAADETLSTPMIQPRLQPILDSFSSDEQVDTHGEESSIAVLELEMQRKLSLPDLSSTKAKNFVIPEHDVAEESKEEISDDFEWGEDCNNVSRAKRPESDSSLNPSYPLNRYESFTTVTSEYTYDDDSTTASNVCPICLSGFKIGSLLIVSKYCMHSFHKECILKWLEKHDDCPVCRVHMMTDSEMSRAATVLVGKTRMCKAVASMQSQAHQRSPPSSPTPRENSTVRRVASRPSMS